jgi:hypothetical protein
MMTQHREMVPITVMFGVQEGLSDNQTIIPAC